MLVLDVVSLGSSRESSGSSTDFPSRGMDSMVLLVERVVEASLGG